MERIDIKSLNLEELTAQLKELGLPAFRAKQIYQWVHEKLVASFDDMTNLSKGLRDQLKERYALITLQIVDVRISQIDGTRKYLFGLPDGHIIEIGESMAYVARRLLAEGKTPEETASITQYPLEFVNAAANHKIL